MAQDRSIGYYAGIIEQILISDIATSPDAVDILTTYVILAELFKELGYQDDFTENKFGIIGLIAKYERNIVIMQCWQDMETKMIVVVDDVIAGEHVITVRNYYKEHIYINDEDILVITPETIVQFITELLV
jgi:hypothetical protein